MYQYQSRESDHGIVLDSEICYNGDMENEIKKAKELGKTGSSKYILHACVTCKRTRWVVFLHDGKPKNLHCKSCANSQEGNPNWRNRRNRDERGYVRINIRKDNFFYPMAIHTGKGSYILEHRLVMAEYLKRCLYTWEQVHHKNRIKDDNRVENLQLTSAENHNPFTVMQAKIDRLDIKIKALEEELKQWRKQKTYATASTLVEV